MMNHVEAAVRHAGHTFAQFSGDVSSTDAAGEEFETNEWWIKVARSVTMAPNSYDYPPRVVRVYAKYRTAFRQSLAGELVLREAPFDPLAQRLPMREQVDAYLWTPEFLAREITIAGELDPDGFWPYASTIGGNPFSHGGLTMQDFTGKLAVITGGASGVGRSLAFALGAEGARVLIADVDAAGLEKTEAELVERNIDARSQRCDVSRQESLDALAATAFDELGGAHLVFANAGISAGEAGNLWEYSAHDWQWTFNVNFWGVVHSINAFMPRLTEQGEEAHLAITGSGNGAFIVYPEQPVYSATKAAVQAVTEALYIQTANQQSPVKVHALFPGPYIVETGIFDSDRVRPEEFAKPEGAPETGINSAEGPAQAHGVHGS